MKPNKIKTLRLSQGWSIRMLAEKATITPTMVMRYESGKVKPRHKVLTKLSEAFSVPVHDLLESDRIKGKSLQDLNSVDFKEQIEKARQLPSEDRQLVAVFIYALGVRNKIAEAMR